MLEATYNKYTKTYFDPCMILWKILPENNNILILWANPYFWFWESILHPLLHYSLYYYKEIDFSENYLTQCANKKDHLWDSKITDFGFFFREAWDGWWILPEPKNFGPGPIAQAQGPFLGAIFGHNGHFELYLLSFDHFPLMVGQLRHKCLVKIKNRKCTFT